MLAPALRNWFGRASVSAPPPPSPTLDQSPLVSARPLAPLASEPISRVERTPPWSRDRLDVTDALWGDGYQFPGGEIEALRLAKPLGLSAASSLLLLGAGSGGAACSMATKLGVWVSGFEADPNLVDAARARIARTKLGKRAQVEIWDPAKPTLKRHLYHHGLALEPLRGAQPEPALSAVAAAIKPGGQLMMVETVADTPLDATDPTVARWALLEGRDPLAVSTEVMITRVLGRLGFDVRIVEDISRRHIEQALLGWRTQAREMADFKPDKRQAALIVGEAELWMVRMRLFRTERLRLVRWHSIGRGSA